MLVNDKEKQTPREGEAKEGFVVKQDGISTMKLN